MKDYHTDYIYLNSQIKMSTEIGLTSELCNPEILKMIQKQVIEDKQTMIKSLEKQLQESLQTTNTLTQSYEKLQTSIQTLNIRNLCQNGFVQENNGRAILTLDITKAIQSNNEEIKVDTKIQVVNSDMVSKLMNQIQVLEEGYKRSMGECELVLKALGEKQQKQASLLREIESLKSQVNHSNEPNTPKQQQNQELKSQLQASIKSAKNLELAYQTLKSQNEELKIKNKNDTESKVKQLEEVNQMLELELDQERREHALEKTNYTEEIRKLKHQIEEEKIESEIEKQKFEELQTLYHQLEKKANKQEEFRGTNAPKKVSEKQMLIQSPQQMLPRVISYTFSPKKAIWSQIELQNNTIPLNIDQSPILHKKPEPIEEQYNEHQLKQNHQQINIETPKQVKCQSNMSFPQAKTEEHKEVKTILEQQVVSEPEKIEKKHEKKMSVKSEQKAEDKKQEKEKSNKNIQNINLQPQSPEPKSQEKHVKQVKRNKFIRIGY